MQKKSVAASTKNWGGNPAKKQRLYTFRAQLEVVGTTWRGRWNPRDQTTCFEAQVSPVFSVFVEGNPAQTWPFRIQVQEFAWYYNLT